MWGIKIVDTQTIVDFPFKSAEDAQTAINERCIIKGMYSPVEITDENENDFCFLPITGMRNL